jgi:hypothetical protein
MLIAVLRSVRRQLAASDRLHVALHVAAQVRCVASMLRVQLFTVLTRGIDFGINNQFGVVVYNTPLLLRIGPTLSPTLFVE